MNDKKKTVLSVRALRDFIAARDGEKPTAQTVRNWISRGLWGVKLKVTIKGNGYFQIALEDFQAFEKEARKAIAKRRPLAAKVTRKMEQEEAKVRAKELVGN